MFLLAVFVLLLLELIILAIARVSNTFLVAPSWASNIRTASVYVGLGFAFLAFYASIAMRHRQNRFHAFIRSILGPVLFFMMGRTMFIFIVPLLAAVFWGHQVEIRYTVSNPTRSGGRGCRSAIGLEELPFGQDTICIHDEALREGLLPGSHIAVTGYGTSEGIFFKTLRIVD